MTRIVTAKIVRLSVTIAVLALFPPAGAAEPNACATVGQHRYSPQANRPASWIPLPPSFSPLPLRRKLANDEVEPTVIDRLLESKFTLDEELALEEVFRQANIPRAVSACTLFARLSPKSRAIGPVTSDLIVTGHRVSERPAQYRLFGLQRAHPPRNEGVSLRSVLGFPEYLDFWIRRTNIGDTVITTLGSPHYALRRVGDSWALVQPEYVLDDKTGIIAAEFSKTMDRLEETGSMSLWVLVDDPEREELMATLQRRATEVFSCALARATKSDCEPDRPLPKEITDEQGTIWTISVSAEEPWLLVLRPPDEPLMPRETDFRLDELREKHRDIN